MVHRAKSSHIGTCLSMADLLAVLYGEVLRIQPHHPTWPERDRFILSKGHGAAILYAALAERGCFPVEWLDQYSADGSPLTGHVSHHVPGIELSTGSLGHGLSVGAGLALAARRSGATWRTVVLCSDGELDEGSNWEPILFAPHHRLGGLTLLVDYNKIQSFGTVEEVLPLEPLADKFRAFRWAVTEIDGHDHAAIRTALTAPAGDMPHCIIAHTVKGRGVDFMEGRLAWHYKSPNDDELAHALAQVEQMS
jgi:transketolase